MRHQQAIRFITDFADQALFVGVLLSGAIFITAFKAIGISPFLIVAISIGLILAYAIFGMHAPVFKLPAERVGDNAYYLGFLFTLISLSNALYYYASDHGAARLISDFGVALGSTVTGVVCRTVLHQLRLDSDHIQENVRESLTDSALRARGEIENVVHEMSALVVSIREKSDENMKKMGELNEALSSRSEVVLRAVGSSLTSLESTLESVTRGVSERLDRLPDELNRSFQKASSSIGNVELTLPTDRIATLCRDLDSLSASVENLSRTLERASTAQKRSIWAKILGK